MRKLLLILGGMMGLAFASCSSDQATENPLQPGNKRLKFTYSVEEIGTGSGVQSRATVPAVTGEENINSLHLIFFEYISGGAGGYLGYMEVTNPNNYKGTAASLDLASDLASKECTVLAVANIDGYLGTQTVADFLTSLVGKSEAEVKQSIATRVGYAADVPPATNALGIPIDGLLMTGSVRKGAEEQLINLTLTRVVARYDVINSQREKYDLVSASIWNTATTSQFWVNNEFQPTAWSARLYTRTTTTTGGLQEDIVGGIYSFENFVGVPTVRDTKTTCLILGIRPRAEAAGDPAVTNGWAVGEITYFRVNIAPAESAQNIKRNNVYQATIRGVNGKGAATEKDAWENGISELDVVINNWDLDDEGTIVTDGQSTLAVPVRRVMLNPEGDSRQYDIFTSGPGTLTLGSVEGDVSNIRVSLDGVTLKVEADPLTPDPLREVKIVVKYGSLTAEVDFVQAPQITNYLEVNMNSAPSFPSLGPDLGSFDPTTGSDNYIIVSASGPWKAKIFNPTSNSTNPGFKFYGIASGAEDEFTQAENGGSSQFKVSTTGNNERVDPNNATGPLIVNSSPRNGFIVVTLLDELGNPTEFTRTIVLRQRGQVQLTLVPDVANLVFNPVGTPTGAGAVATTPGSSFEIAVDAGADEETSVANDWNFTTTGSDITNYFTVEKVGTSLLRVTAKGTDTSNPYMNLTARELTGSIKVYVGNDPTINTTGLFSNITVSQAPVTFTITPDPAGTTVTLPTNGETRIVTVTTHESLSWTATITTNDWDKHTGYFLSGGNKVTTSVMGTGTGTFTYGFDKILYPNIDQTPGMTIKVEMNEAPTVFNEQLTVVQTPLVRKPVNIIDMGPSGWGSLTTADVTGNYQSYMRNSAFFGPSGVVKLANVANTYANANGFNVPYPTSYTYLHCGGDHNTNSATQWQPYKFTKVKNWMNNVETNGRITVWPGDYTGGRIYSVGESPLNGRYYRAGRAGNNARINASLASTNRLMQFLVQTGPFGAVANAGTMTWTSDGYSSSVTPEGPAWWNALPVMTDPSGNVTLFIEPAGARPNAGGNLDWGIVFYGESQYFVGTGGDWGTSPTALGPKGRFTSNLLSYILFTAAYGSNFSDLFLLPYDTYSDAEWQAIWDQMKVK